MDKEQALQAFWASFGVPAYDENTVPDGAELPRITYSVSTGELNYPVSLTASIWDRSKSWKSVTDIARTVLETISRGGCTIPYTGGVIWLKTANTPAQRMGDTDDSIRRIVISLQAEFFSEV